MDRMRRTLDGSIEWDSDNDDCLQLGMHMYAGARHAGLEISARRTIILLLLAAYNFYGREVWRYCCGLWLPDVGSVYTRSAGFNDTIR